MMRNPLSRKMFANAQQRKQDARMPSGILASGPTIMKAAMQQQPVKAANGVFANLTGADVSAVYGARPAPGINLTNANAQPNLLTGGGDESLMEVPVQQSTLDALITGNTTPAPAVNVEQTTADVGDDVESSAEMEGGSKIAGPLVLPARKPPLPDNKKGAIDFGTLGSLLESLKKDDGGKKKTTKQYIDESKALLKEYGIDSPDLKSRRDMRIVEFFLNMAAGRSPDALENVADAAKESFKGYGQDVREVEAAEQKLSLAGIEMGMSKEAREEASDQAILLKKYDIAADVFNKINDLPDKSQQIKVLMETYGVGQQDAIDLVYKTSVTPSGFSERRSLLVEAGLSPAVATLIAQGGSSLLVSLADNPAVGDRIASAVTAQGGSLNPADVQILGVQTEN